MKITTSSENHEKDPETDLIYYKEQIEGIGEAIAVLETSIDDIECIMSKIDTTSQSTNSSETTPDDNQFIDQGQDSFWILIINLEISSTTSYYYTVTNWGSWANI